MLPTTRPRKKFHSSRSKQKQPGKTEGLRFVYEAVTPDAMNPCRITHPKAGSHPTKSADAAQNKLYISAVCDADSLLTKKELAQKLKKSVRSIENWMKLRYLPYIKIGHSVLFRWRDVVEALDHFHVR
jgi:hypothetical protein